MLLLADNIWSFLGLLQVDQVLQESTGETTSASFTLRFLPHTKPLSFSFLEVYFLAYLSTLTEHVLHPVLSLVIYSSSWEKKNIQRWSYIIYIMFNVFILLKILLVSRFSPSDPASCVLVFNSGYPNTNFSFCLKVRKLTVLTFSHWLSLKGCNENSAFFRLFYYDVSHLLICKNTFSSTGMLAFHVSRPVFSIQMYL